jgi:hypothetical protein
LIVDAEQLLCRIPGFDAALVSMRAVLDRAEAERPRVREKIDSLIRSFLFHIRGYDEDVSVLTKVVNACLQGRELETPGQKAEQRRIWQKAAADARWYASHLLLMSALDVVRGSSLFRISAPPSTLNPVNSRLRRLTSETSRTFRTSGNHSSGRGPIRSISTPISV